MKKMTEKKAAVIFLVLVISVLGTWKIISGYDVPKKEWKKTSVKRTEEKQKQFFTPLQIQYLPGKNGFLVDRNAPVYGFAVGYALQQNEISGVSLALMHAYNAQKKGLSLSLLELSGTSSGVAINLAGGSVQNKGVALGLWNMTEANHGVQLGLINQEEKNLLVDYSMKKIDQDSEKKFGVQAGVLNYSESPGVQFGLWNSNPNSLLKHFPLINICF